jgi:hypothetical protein
MRGAHGAPLAVLLAVALTALIGTAGALAHGDPTAHYLETDSLLTSYAAPPAVAVELRLRGVLDAAAERGYPIKVVLFANEADTGGEPEPLEDTQTYVTTVSDQLDEISPLRAPVLIVTPQGFGLGGRQPRDGAVAPITRPLAAELARHLPLAKKADGNALARTAMVAVRRLAAAGGHPLPKRIPPAEQNLNGILGTAASRGRETLGGPWLIAAVLGATALLLGALLVAVHRRATREPLTKVADLPSRARPRSRSGGPGSSSRS